MDRSLPTWSVWLRAIGIVLLVAQVALEGPRWQMWPAYLVVVWLGLSPWWLGMAMPGAWTGLAAGALFVCAGWLATVLPVFRLPPPRGSYSIGTQTRELADVARRETQVAEGGPRELIVQFWYPAARPGPAQPYRAARETSFRRSRLALVATHGTADSALFGPAPFSGAALPALLDGSS